MNTELLINKLERADEILSAMMGYCIEELTESERKYRLLNETARIKFLFTEVELLLKTDTGATHGKLPFRKHDVSGSAAYEEISNAGNGVGNFLGETRPVSGNEQTKEVLTQCKCVWPACNHLHNCRNR